MFTSLSQVVLTELETAGVVYLKFEDIRDADKVALKVKHSRPMWRVEHTKPYQFSLKHVAGSSPVSNFEGQIQVAALFNGSGEKFNVGNVMNHIKELLEAHGDVMAMKTDSVNAWAFAYRAEFFDATVVKTAVRAVNHRNLGVSSRPDHRVLAES